MFYTMLLMSLKENSLSYLSAWENDLQLDITVEKWEKGMGESMPLGFK